MCVFWMHDQNNWRMHIQCFPQFCDERRSSQSFNTSQKTTCNHTWWQWIDRIASLFLFLISVYFVKNLSLFLCNNYVRCQQYVNELRSLCHFWNKHASCVHSVDFLIWSLSGFFVMTSLFVFFIRRADGMHFALREKKKSFTVLVGPYIEKYLPSVTFLRPRGNIFIYVFYMNIFI